MSRNVDYEVCSKLRTAIEGIECKPDVVQIVPSGADQHRPSEGADYWVNIAPKDNLVVPETNNAYISTTIVTITVCVESVSKLDGITKTLTQASADVVQAVIYSNLGGFARRSPNYKLEGYSGGEENNSIYYYTMVAEFEVQVENN